MSDELERLERELAALKPRAVSQATRQRLEARLEGDARRRGVWTPWWARGVVAAAACLAVAVTVWLMMPHDRGGLPGHPPPASPPGAGVATVPLERMPPTAMSYMLAWQQSPQALEALLDHHAATLLPHVRDETTGAAPPRPSSRRPLGPRANATS